MLIRVWIAVVFGASATLAAGPRVIPAEPAPGDLGGVRPSHSFALVDGNDSLYLVDASKGLVREYSLESGTAKGDPIRLHRADGPFTVSGPVNAALDGNTLAVGTPAAGVTLFDLRDGSATMQREDVRASSIESASRSRWLIAPQFMVAPGIGVIAGDLGWDEFSDGYPRMILADEALEILVSGLEVADGGEELAARGLEFAVTDQSIFAAELANYRLYRLSKSLRVERVYEDTSLFRERALSEEAADEQIGQQLEQVVAERAKAGIDPTRPRQPPTKATARAFRYQSTIHDLVWSPALQRLVLLVSKPEEGVECALDLVNPGAGDRVRLAIDPVDESFSCARIIATANAIWIVSFRKTPHPIQKVSKQTILDVLWDPEGPPESQPLSIVDLE